MAHSTTLNLKTYIAKKGYIKPRYLNLIFATLICSVLSLAMPVMTLQVYDRVLPNPDGNTLPVLIIGVIVALVLEAGLKALRSYAVEWPGAVLEYKLQCDLFKHALLADQAKLGSSAMIGETMKTISSTGRIKEFYDGANVITVCEICFLPIFFILIAIIAEELVFVPIIMGILYALINLRMNRKLKALLEAREEHDDKRYDYLLETLAGVHTIKSFALEKHFLRKYEHLKEGVGETSYVVAEHMSKLSNIGSTFTSLTTLAVIGVGALFVLEQQMTTGALIATIMLAGRVMQPLQKGLSVLTRQKDYELEKEKMEEILAAPQLVPEENVDLSAAEGRITLENVGFKYSSGKENLFEGLSLTLEPKECISIAAAYGLGETTLLKVIAGIYEPTEGRALIDGIDASHYPPDEIVKRVGFMETEGVIFRGTIRDNITRFGMTEEASAREISKKLGINAEVAILPNGFNTMLEGLHNDRIPEGLKQRIAMARALSPHPRIVLFDQADRDLDREGYKLVFDFLANLKGKATMILVSDDKNITSLADNHYVMGDGTLKKWGRIMATSDTTIGIPDFARFDTSEKGTPEEKAPQAQPSNDPIIDLKNKLHSTVFESREEPNEWEMSL